MYVGIDLHKRYMQTAVIDDEDNIAEQRIPTDRNNSRLDAFLDQLSPDSMIVLESSSVWMGVYRHIRGRDFNVILSNPFQTKAVGYRDVKTDQKDAVTLAKLLKSRMIIPCYVPNDTMIDFRYLVRHRLYLTGVRASLKNSIHSILNMYGTRIPANPFTKKYIEELGKLGNYRIDHYLDMYRHINATINDTNRRIKSAVDERDESDARLLLSIPGVGYYTALVMVAEICDVGRFSNSHKLVSYSGMAPSTYSSGGKTRHGRITKHGSRYLRWVLVEAVQCQKRLKSENDIMDFYWRISNRRGPQKATVAAAAKLLRTIYWMLKEKREFVPRYRSTSSARTVREKSRLTRWRHAPT